MLRVVDGRTVARPLAHALQLVIGGGRLRERMLLGLLGVHYESRFVRDWWTGTPPHFFNHRIGAFSVAYRRPSKAALAWARAFAVADIVEAGDRALDVGCGDGFFTSRITAPLCSHVDAIDIDPSAIGHARKFNSAANVTYHLADATTEPFPSPPYDIVVWDGALGHFGPETVRTMLERIAAALKPTGLFCGSESLGEEGHDHLQYFPDADAVVELIGGVFPHVAFRELVYPIRGGERREILWRAAQSSGTLHRSWRRRPDVS
jgi:SAM-dependent methyltransferase